MSDLPPYPPPKPKKPRLPVWKVEHFLRLNLGFIGAAAKELGVTTQAIRARIKSSARLTRLMIEIDEDVTDFSRSNIVRAIGQGDQSAARFWLKYRAGKDWSTRSILAGEDDKPLNLNLGLENLDADSIAELARLLGPPKAEKDPSGSDPK